MRLVFILVMALASCAPIGQQVHVIEDTWTGTREITVGEREIYRDSDAIVVARPAVYIAAGTPRYGVFLNMRTRTANGPIIQQITYGTTSTRLPYQKLDRLRTHCIDGCQKAEIGWIPLSAEAFEIATHTGLPIRIWGKRRRAEGRVPAEAFAKVWGRLGAT